MRSLKEKEDVMEAKTLFGELEGESWRWARVEERRLARALRTAAPPALRPVRVAGFRVGDEPEPQGRDAREQRRARLATLRAAARGLKKELAGQGLPPLAVLPAPVWRAFAEDAGLYLFEHLDQDGATKGEIPFRRQFLVALFLLAQLSLIAAASLFPQPFPAAPWLEAGAALIASLWIGHTREFARVAFAASAPLFAPALAVLSLLPRGSNDEPALILVFAALVALVAGGAGFCAAGETAERLRPRLLPVLARRAGTEATVAALWPARRDDPPLLSDDAARFCTVRPLFPDPPPETAEILRRAAALKLRLCVAAAPEAVRVDFGELAESLAREERQRREAVRDPVVYLIQGDLVAILAQFGELDAEREAVGRALADGFV